MPPRASPVARIPLRIDRASPGDAAALAALGRRTYRAHYATIWSPAGLEAYLAAQFAPERLAADLGGDRVRYYFAREAAGEPPVGFAKVVFDRPPPVAPPHSAGRTPVRDTAAPAGLELEKLYFEPAATGRGYGGALIEYVAAVARDAAQPCVWLDVLKTNAGGRRVYERHGFVVVGELPFRTDRAQIDFWVMYRPLGPADAAAG